MLSLSGNLRQESLELKFPSWIHACVSLLVGVWNPLSLDPSSGVLGRFDLAALLQLPHLKCLFIIG